jgi:hypothetical protein
VNSVFEECLTWRRAPALCLHVTYDILSSPVRVFTKRNLELAQFSGPVPSHQLHL